MKGKNFVNGPDIPMGFGMALSKNLPAMEYFSSLNQTQQQNVLQQTHQIGSKQEMEEFVDNLPGSAVQ